jgi:hypothetical protein
MAPKSFKLKFSIQDASGGRCSVFPPPLGNCKESFKPAWVFLDADCKEIVFNWCKGQFHEVKDNIFKSKDECLRGRLTHGRLEFLENKL